MIICHLCSAKPLTKLQLTQFIVTHASYESAMMEQCKN